MAIRGQTGAHRVYEGTQDSAKANDGSIVERGDNGRVYRYIPKFDHTVIIQNGRSSQPLKGNQLPSQVNQASNSMDSYIDEVLDRSGMTGKNIPVPAERPTDMEDGGPINTTMTGTDNHPGKMKDDMATPVTASAETESEGMSIGDILLGALGLGGAAMGGRALYNAYKSGYRPQNAAEVAADAAALETPEGMNEAGVVDKSGRIPDQKLLTGPNKAITDQSSQRALPSPTDESIAATLGDEEFDQRFAANVEGTAQRPSTQSRFKQGQANIGPKLEQEVKALADSGDLRGALVLLRENGVELDDRMLQSIIERFPGTAAARSQVKGLAQRAGRKAVSQ